ncbi:MAG: 3-methyladenine DNA glycosylase AlkC [Cryomorphaceae bacterium]
MPEPFKNLFNSKLIIGIGENISKAWSPFDATGFNAAASKNLDTLELKQRSAQISDALTTFLPSDYEKSATILLASLAPAEDCDAFNSTVYDNGLAGWAIMPLTHYVSRHGLNHFDLSMMLLKEMTKRSSSEFDIRTFLLDSPQRTLSVLQEWTQDPNQHVRRLASEGSRPRLPWAMRLPMFIEDPSPLIPLLDALKDDDEEYVRRSVANNLNDIAKDHPDVVARIAGDWLKGASKNRQRLVRHACRTLIKQGHKATLAALGYRAPSAKLNHLKILTPQVTLGNALSFELALESTSDTSQPLIIDYAIHHRKANGTTSPKVFKWKTITLEPLKTLTSERKHSMQKITTRVYYPGVHSLEILINGVPFGSKEFCLNI